MHVSKVLLPLAVASFVVGSLSFAYAQTTSTMPGSQVTGSTNDTAAATTGNGVSSQTPTGSMGTANSNNSTMSNSPNSGVSPTTGMPSGDRTPRADRN